MLLNQRHKLAIAPMMDWTDRHCRYLHRLIVPSALLYTEMLTTGALLHGDAARLLRFDAAEHPVALQLGGSEPAALAAAAQIGQAAGYDEINLNCGCPSDRVQKGRFGACLMAEPALVADCITAMRAAVTIPVTVKCRIGIDDSEEDAFLHRFVEQVAAAGCQLFIVHARKAWLKGLSPKANREVPPLRYPVVHRLKAARPDLQIILNGGLRDPGIAATEARGLDGVMIGREAYENPWRLRDFATALDLPVPPLDRTTVVVAMAAYAAREAEAGVPLRAVMRPMLGLFNGLPGARAWRRHLSERSVEPGAGPRVLLDGLASVRQPETAAAA